jgi:hypothetical protein
VKKTLVTWALRTATRVHARCTRNSATMPPTDAEWQQFLGHFERRKVATGTCGRAFATPCPRARASAAPCSGPTPPSGKGSATSAPASPPASQKPNAKAGSENR